MIPLIRSPFQNFIFLFFVFLPLLSLCSSTERITSCLSHHNIKNFTTFPQSENESKTYYNLLNYSIQNLRFADHSISKPIAIILPESLEQLVKSVLCCREGPWEMRVRCGGHSYEGTSSAANDGAPFVVIDMMNLKHVDVSMENETAWVEGGATLGETYYEISRASNGTHGFSAGSCPTVGVGGHISGGGFGLLSRKYGLAADHVLDALLIDANGRLLDKQAMGEDVFWAIRGGGGGVWGIIYAWKIRLLKVPEVVTSFVVSRPGTKWNVAKLVYKWQYAAPNLQDDFYLSCFVGAGLPETKTIGLSTTFKGFYLGPKNEALSIIERVFPELGLLENDCKEMSWIDSVVFFSGLSKGSSASDLQNRYLEDKNYFKAKSDFVRSYISLTGIKIALNILEKEPKGYVILDPYGGIMNKISSDSIAFPHRSGNLFVIQYLVAWYEEDNDKREAYVDWIRRFYNAMMIYVSGRPRAAYVNYVDFDLGVMEEELIISGGGNYVEMARSWGEKYFLKNYDRLVRAKTKIDPNNVFSNQQGIPPLSSGRAEAK